MTDPTRGTPPGHRHGQAPQADKLYGILVESLRDYAIIVLDPAGRIMSWNEGAERITGYAEEDVVDRHYSMLYPPEVGASGGPDHQLEIAREESRFEGEGWRVRRDGTRFWAHVVITPLWENDQLVGFGKVTGDLTAEREAQEALRQRERQLSEAQQIAHLGSWEWDVVEDVVTWSDELYRIYGVEIGTPMDLDRYASMLHDEDRERAMGVIQGAMEAREPFAFEHRLVRPDGEVRHLQSRGDVIVDEAGAVVRLIGTALDVTDRVRAREKDQHLEAERLLRQKAEQSARRMGFLAEASQLLSTSLDYEATLRNVASLAVPDFADWCAVEMVKPEGGMRRLTVAHRDPERVELADRMRDRFPTDRDDPRDILNRVMESGQAELIAEVSDEVLDEVAQHEEHRAMLEEVGIRSAILAPIGLRERVVGVITFLYAESERSYTEEDLVVARELAGRAALAIENAQLHGAEQEARGHAERAGERMSRLQAVTAGLSEAVTPRAVAEVIVVEGLAALDAAHGALALVREDGTLDLAHSSGLRPGVAERLREFGRDWEVPLAQAIRTGESLLIERGSERDRRFPAVAESWAPPGSGAIVAIPARSGDRIIGALEFGYPGDRTFVPEDRDFLVSLGRQCAQALDRALLYAAEHVARQEAEAASRAKSQFLAVMSHELRTPLSAILGYQELLFEGIVGPVTQRQKDQLARIRASATHLRDLINQLLDLSRIEAGKADVQLEEVDLAELARDIALLMEQEARSKGLELRTEIPVESVEIETDPAKVRQILLNLLSNAIKFTEEGEVALMLEATPSSIALAVEDTGMGIADEDREKVFEDFTQIDQSMTRRAGGSGLGLPLSRRLAQLLGGELELERTPRRGSRFTLRLPITHDSAQQKAG